MRCKVQLNLSPPSTKAGHCLTTQVTHLVRLKRGGLHFGLIWVFRWVFKLTLSYILVTFFWCIFKSFKLSYILVCQRAPRHPEKLNKGGDNREAHSNHQHKKSTGHIIHLEGFSPDIFNWSSQWQKVFLVCPLMQRVKVKEPIANFNISSSFPRRGGRGGGGI